MSPLRAYFPAMALGLWAGCATGYHGMSLTGGFTETQLAPGVYRVTFEGNGYSRSERVQDFAMLRAAELALAHGFTHFTLLDAHESNRYLFTGDELIVKPQSGITVRLVRGQPAGAFDADFLARTVRAKYRLDRKSG
jgi:hypothetical protein